MDSKNSHISQAQILRKYVGDRELEIFSFWEEPHRKFHTRNHLNDVLNYLSKQYDIVENEMEWEALILAAFFHDVVYVPGEKDNEENSAKIMMDMVVDKTDSVVLLAKSIIIDTKQLGKKEGIYNIFQTADCWKLIYGSFEDILPYEKCIFQEFQKFSWDKYKKERVAFLRNAAKIFSENENILNRLADYVNSHSPNIGIYAGSFNPFTIGHLNILRQSEKIFDKVIIAFGNNPDKEKRTVVIPKTIENRECVVYCDLLSNLLKRYVDMGCSVTLIRGLRNEYDLNYERNLIQYIKDVMPSLKVILLLCDKEFEHISSGSIRNLKNFGHQEITDKYTVP